MAMPIKIGRYSAKKLSCEAPMPSHASIPAITGSPQHETTPKNASREDNTPTDVVPITLFLLILFIFNLYIRSYLYEHYFQKYSHLFQWP